MTVQTLTAHTPLLRRRPLIRAAAIGFSAAWIAGLAVPVPDVAVDASAAPLAGHEGALAVRALLVHGVAAVAIAVIALALARAAGGERTRRVVLGAGLSAAALSVVQCVLELAFTADHGDALIEAVNRLDGLKMVALGVLALAGSRALSRGLRALGAVLAAAIFVSAAGYGLLMPALAPAAFVSLPLLLVWMTGAGLALARR